MVDVIDVVSADDGLLIVNAVGDGSAGSGEADNNRVEWPLRSVGGGLAGFNVKSYITAIADGAVSYDISAAVNAIDMSVTTVYTREKIEIAAGFKDSVPEVLVEERANNDARVGNAAQHLVFRR